MPYTEMPEAAQFVSGARSNHAYGEPGFHVNMPSAWPMTGNAITDNPYDDSISREEDSLSPLDGSLRAKGRISLPWSGNAGEWLDASVLWTLTTQ